LGGYSVGKKEKQMRGLIKVMLVAVAVLAVSVAPAAMAAKPKKQRATKAAHLGKSASHFVRARSAPIEAIGSADREVPYLRSAAALVVEEATGRVVYAKNVDAVHPIASITKLMTAVVVLEAGLSLGESIAITNTDVDRERLTRSRLRVGEVLPRSELLRLALMASENRAAAALGRAYPGGISAFVAAMNEQAQKLGMTRTRFMDSTGLSAGNVSTPADLVKLVRAAAGYPAIRQYSTTPGLTLTQLDTGRQIEYRNTNLLLRHDNDWQINVSKTGYINESGQCLVLQAKIAERTMNIVLLDSSGHHARIVDATRVRKWLEDHPRAMLDSL
jgi:serine-type D-Ala-D-Ala endopeptidase (penicillin-binding protein 7)